MVIMKDKEKIVEESVKTKRAREKLQKRIDVLDKKMTAQALEKKTAEIHRWIAVNAASRVVLQNKTISLFDENQNSAHVSRKVEGLVDQLREEIQAENRKIKEVDVLKKLRDIQPARL